MPLNGHHADSVLVAASPGARILRSRHDEITMTDLHFAFNPTGNGRIDSRSRPCRINFRPAKPCQVDFGDAAIIEFKQNVILIVAPRESAR